MANRLQHIFEAGHLHENRRLFEALLALVGSGVLDEARDRFAANGTFGTLLHSLAKHQPAWHIELVAHWLKRHTLCPEGIEGLPKMGRSSIDAGELLQSARKAPGASIEHLLPVVVAVARKFTREENPDFAGLPMDSVWPYRHVNEDLYDIKEAALAACERDIEFLGENSPEKLRPIIDLLKVHRNYTLNHLLVYSYLTSPARYAEEALQLLAEDPKRLCCGYSDSSFWLARRLLKKASPYCGESLFAKIEAITLNYLPKYEQGVEGRRWRGQCAYDLTSALAPARLSAKARERLAAWGQTFSQKPAPKGVRAHKIGSPVNRQGGRSHVRRGVVGRD